MCIAILKPKNETISEDRLRACATNNKDGCGLAYIEDGIIKIFKTLNIDEFLSVYKEVEHKSNMLLHFRIATHGKVCPDNCHPFQLNHRMVLVHNGVISGYGDKETKVDTQDFIDKVIGNISWKMWKNESFRRLVGDAIGYSKFAILDASDEYYIINEDKGNWTDGVWYSNESFKPKEVKPSTYNYWTNYYKYDDDEYVYDKGTYSATKNKYTKDIDDVDEGELIFKCKDCGEVFYKKENRSLFYACPKCHKYNANEIGFRIDGVDYYYEDEGTIDEKYKAY